MTQETRKKNLVILVADKSMQVSLNAIIERWDNLDIHSISSDTFVHPHHDPGCFNKSHEFLRPFIRQYDYALVMFDRDGSGKEELTREEIEQIVEENLSKSGWKQHSAAIVLDPELEIWIWSDSPHVDHVLGWEGQQPDLRSWLRDRDYLEPDRIKPDRPKEAMQTAIRHVNKSFSSSLHKQIAEKISYQKCNDPAFLKLCAVLRTWFPPSP